jgi:predicted GTPase
MWMLFLTVLQDEYEAAVRSHLKFMPWVPIVFVSALEGVNVSAVIDQAIAISQERRVRVPTRKLWELMQRALMRRAAPTKGVFVVFVFVLLCVLVLLCCWFCVGFVVVFVLLYCLLNCVSSIFS